MDQLNTASDHVRRRLTFAFDLFPAFESLVRRFETAARLPASFSPREIGRLLATAVKAPWIYIVSRSYLRRALEGYANSSNLSPHRRARHRAIAYRSLAIYLRTIRKAAELEVYERLFSLWHLLHFPLFLMMVITAVAHVVAVHMY